MTISQIFIKSYSLSVDCHAGITDEDLPIIRWIARCVFTTVELLGGAQLLMGIIIALDDLRS